MQHRGMAKCRTRFIREGFTMAIVKKVTDLNHPAEKKHLVLPAFSFATDDASATNLANMIIDAWNNVPFTFTPPGGTPITVPLGTTLVQRDANKLPTTLAKQTALARVQQAGFANLTGAVVITEVEHDNNYIMQSDSEIVFVLPDQNRVTLTPAGPALLDTAKLLLACTPNGI
jgi:hypothetical protein